MTNKTVLKSVSSSSSSSSSFFSVTLSSPYFGNHLLVLLTVTWEWVCEQTTAGLSVCCWWCCWLLPPAAAFFFIDGDNRNQFVVLRAKRVVFLLTIPFFFVGCWCGCGERKKNEPSTLTIDNGKDPKSRSLIVITLLTITVVVKCVLVRTWSTNSEVVLHFTGYYVPCVRNDYVTVTVRTTCPSQVIKLTVTVNRPSDIFAISDKLKLPYS